MSHDDDAKNKHFTHEHMQIPMEPDDDHGKEIKCHGCDRVMEDSFYGCPAYQFFLHTRCSGAPRSIQHPSHPSHPLALFPTPTYATRSYHCDACGLQGKSFSYACAECEFDLHFVCASLPQTLVIDDEEFRLELKLVFEPPIINSEDETNHELMLCCICDENILSYWLYYSEEYKQFMHLTCFLSSGKRDPETDDGGGGGSEVVSESSGVGKLETAADDLADGNECYFDCPSFYSAISIT